MSLCERFITYKKVVVYLFYVAALVTYTYTGSALLIDLCGSGQNFSKLKLKENLPRLCVQANPLP